MLHKVISIEGNIGAGKTTLATLIAQHTGRKLLLEQFEQNPFLADFYVDANRFAFHTELFFLAERFEQWRQMPNVPVVADYSLAKSLYFAEVTLKGPELDTFNRIYQGLIAMAAKPDLTIYLYRTTSQLADQIRNRGRLYEQDIPAAYLEMIHGNYLKHLQADNDKPILLVDAQHLDFEKQQDVDWVLQMLDKTFPPGLTRV